MTLDATVGTTTANSYVTLVEAEAYFETRIHSSTWTAITSDSQKESLLISSTSMIDWYITWKGVKTSTTQSLQWPRTSVIRRDGTEVATNIIPNDVKTAVYELALSSIASDRTADSNLAGIKKVQVSTLLVQATDGGYDSTEAQTIPEKIKRILSDLMSNSGIGVVRLMRA